MDVVELIIMFFLRLRERCRFYQIIIVIIVLGSLYAVHELYIKPEATKRTNLAKNDDLETHYSLMQKYDITEDNGIKRDPSSQNKIKIVMPKGTMT
jgi:hypothetical protein